MDAAIAIPEVTIGKHGQWHVHLHILATGKFIPQAQLKAAWYEATGDSFIVDIQAVHSREDAAKYVAGYVAKPADVAKWSNHDICEYAAATHGMRFLRTYGAHKLNITDEDDEQDTPPDSRFVADINHVLRAEHAGIEQVRHAVDILSRLGVTVARALDRDDPGDYNVPIDAREVAYAVDVAERVASAFPKLPDVQGLEDSRRFHFGLPPRERPYVQRMEQLGLEIIRPPTRV